VLPAQLQRHPAGYEEPDVGTGGQQLGELPCNRQHLLEVIQDEQQLAVAEGLS
jgi:hypothetical protein